MYSNWPTFIVSIQCRPIVYLYRHCIQLVHFYIHCVKLVHLILQCSSQCTFTDTACSLCTFNRTVQCRQLVHFYYTINSSNALLHACNEFSQCNFTLQRFQLYCTSTKSFMRLPQVSAFCFILIAFLKMTGNFQCFCFVFCVNSLECLQQSSSSRLQRL